MAGALNHSPADVVRRLLIQLGHGVDPPTNAWPVYASRIPSSPDAVVRVTETADRDQGRRMNDGERAEMHGVQIMVRHAEYATGFAKAREIARSLDVDVYDETVTISGAVYNVHQVSRTTGVLSLGDEPETKRSLFTVNVDVSLRQTS